MYLPKIYEKFSDKFPEVLKEFKQLGQTCREAGPLDQKSQDLIKPEPQPKKSRTRSCWQ